MDETLVGIMEILGPAILLVVLIWLVVRVRRRPGARDEPRTEQATREEYADEERRRREGTDEF